MVFEKRKSKELPTDFEGTSCSHEVMKGDSQLYVKCAKVQ